MTSSWRQNDETPKTREPVFEKVYGIIFTPFLVQNVWKFVNGSFLQESIAKQNLVLFA